MLQPYLAIPIFTELPSDELPSDEFPSDELPSDELPSDELPSDELLVARTSVEALTCALAHKYFGLCV